MRVTVSLLAAEWATKHVLQQILGLFASVFIFRREFFCIFHHIFKFLEDLLKEEVWSKVPHFIRDEFRGGGEAMHLCISTADLRAEPSPEIYVTDATRTDNTLHMGFGKMFDVWSCSLAFWQVNENVARCRTPHGTTVGHQTLISFLTF